MSYIAIALHFEARKWTSHRIQFRLSPVSINSFSFNCVNGRNEGHFVHCNANTELECYHESHSNNINCFSQFSEEIASGRVGSLSVGTLVR